MQQPDQHTMDLRPLVEVPQENTEEYWNYAAQVAPQLGTQVVLLCRDKTEEYVDWVEHIEESYDAQLPLNTELSKLKQQLKSRPYRAWPLEVPLIDYNTAALYMGSAVSLETQAKSTRRASASRAYSRIGAINQAQDIGLYMGALLPAVIMNSPSPRDRDNFETITDWSLDKLVAAGDEARSTFQPTTDSYLNLALREPHHQPGRLNFSTAMMMEIGTYFLDKEGVIDGHCGFDAEEIAESSFFVAKKILDEADTENRASYFSPSVENELMRRSQDVRFLDLYREAKHGYETQDIIEAKFVTQQLEYIDKFREWAKNSEASDGVGFEWIAALMLRHETLRQGAIDSAYVHFATPRSDDPEDDLRGNASSRKQSFDILLNIEGERHFIQCKTKGGNNKYANPPIKMLIARKVFSKLHSFKPLMPDYLRVANELEAIYKNNAQFESDAYLEAEAIMLEELGLQ